MNLYRRAPTLLRTYAPPHLRTFYLRTSSPHRRTIYSTHLLVPTCTYAPTHLRTYAPSHLQGATLNRHGLQTLSTGRVELHINTVLHQQPG